MTHKSKVSLYLRGGMVLPVLRRYHHADHIGDVTRDMDRGHDVILEMPSGGLIDTFPWLAFAPEDITIVPPVGPAWGPDATREFQNRLERCNSYASMILLAMVAEDLANRPRMVRHL